MLADPATSAAARAGNFLELWQTGFGGHLVSALKFEWAALYTLCTILVLIGITVTAAELRRRADSAGDQDDLRRRSDQRDLLATLARAQLIINRDRLATPARFAAELAGAADGLRALLALAEQTQHATLEVAGRYDTTARELTSAVRALHGATTNMTSAAARVHVAAGDMDKSSQELRTDMRTQVAAAADRLDAAAAAARDELTAHRETGRNALEELDRQLIATLNQMTERMRVATSDLVAAGDTHAEAIRTSGEDAALHIGQSYQEAVLAATEELRKTLLAATGATQDAVTAAVTPLLAETGNLTEAIQQAQTSAAERVADASRRSEDQLDVLRASSGEVAKAAARSEKALRQHSAMLRDHVTALGDNADRISGAVDAVGTAAARQETALDRHAEALAAQVNAVRETAARMAEALDPAAQVFSALENTANRPPDSPAEHPAGGPPPPWDWAPAGEDQQDKGERDKEEAP